MRLARKGWEGSALCGVYRSGGRRSSIALHINMILVGNVGVVVVVVLCVQHSHA